ncbi:hypothetical protein PtA15_1A364 [Puccinia triticina]|uniref:Uncharacterized protein n=1 Tax=Puccinia triticina TaxID=208348 RepID=A0ABY7CA47_9BASI|nr:uncharacterized protein PtA15_1A364 [Puccinia triticina]WAQ81026.1 hypothetical protein PtA15_1A364 [Puccinia triticina]
MHSFLCKAIGLNLESHFCETPGLQTSSRLLADGRCTQAIGMCSRGTCVVFKLGATEFARAKVQRFPTLPTRQKRLEIAATPKIDKTLEELGCGKSGPVACFVEGTSHLPNHSLCQESENIRANSHRRDKRQDPALVSYSLIQRLRLHLPYCPPNCEGMDSLLIFQIWFVWIVPAFLRAAPLNPKSLVGLPDSTFLEASQSYSDVRAVNIELSGSNSIATSKLAPNDLRKPILLGKENPVPASGSEGYRLLKESSTLETEENPSRKLKPPPSQNQKAISDEVMRSSKPEPPDKLEHSGPSEPFKGNLKNKHCEHSFRNRNSK